MNLNKIHKDSCFSEKVNHSMIHFLTGFFPPTGKEKGPKGPQPAGRRFCKHSVWISTTHFWGEPQPPAVEKCYDFLNFGHFALTGWEALCYPELAEILCTAPLQLNTQHNKYFPLPVGRVARSRQTITHDWGEGIMILLLPHASDGVTELGL